MAVPSHSMNKYRQWVAARTVDEKTSCLGRRSTSTCGTMSSRRAVGATTRLTGDIEIGSSTQRANLRRRIDTDLLTINISLPMHDYAAEHSPVMDALKSFGSNFRQAIGQVIGFIAILVPWLVIIVPGIILMRLLWRWISRWIARRERRAAEVQA
jgi:hypothetical protein